MRNALKTITGVSAANTEKTHTIAAPTINSNSSKQKEIGIRSLTVSTGGADLAADCTVAIKDNGVTVWSVELRTGKVFGGHFRFDYFPVIIRNGDCTIVTDAGGVAVVVTVSAVYSII